LISVNSVSSALKSPFNNSTGISRTLPAFSTVPPLRPHSNARNPFPLMRLLHASLDTRGVGSPLATHHSSLTTIPFRITSLAPRHHLTHIDSYSCEKQGRGVSSSTHHSSLTTIPFRIIFFAHPHPLTPIESHSCKKHRGGWASQTLLHRAGFAR
jgi:hypothetical protein